MTLDSNKRINVSIDKQRLYLLEGSDILMNIPVSTAKNGAGQNMDSGCTPKGRHIVRAKIGEDAPRGGVFVGRRFTGEIYNDELAEQNPQRDWILTRILWLSGIEHGFNRLGNVDSMRRYIYIHGTPDENAMGVADSAGCIRVDNDDILVLFNNVQPGTLVHIE